MLLNLRQGLLVVPLHPLADQAAALLLQTLRRFPLRRADVPRRVDGRGQARGRPEVGREVGVEPGEVGRLRERDELGGIRAVDADALGEEAVDRLVLVERSVDEGGDGGPPLLDHGGL